MKRSYHYLVACAFSMMALSSAAPAHAFLFNSDAFTVSRVEGKIVLTDATHRSDHRTKRYHSHQQENCDAHHHSHKHKKHYKKHGYHGRGHKRYSHRRHHHVHAYGPLGLRKKHYAQPHKVVTKHVYYNYWR